MLDESFINHTVSSFSDANAGIGWCISSRTFLPRREKRPAFHCMPRLSLEISPLELLKASFKSCQVCVCGAGGTHRPRSHPQAAGWEALLELRESTGFVPTHPPIARDTAGHSIAPWGLLTPLPEMFRCPNADS